MASSVTTQHGVLGGKVLSDTSADAVVNADVTGAAGNVNYVQVNNLANSTAVYLKFYNVASPTVGTTAPSHIFRCGAAKTEYFIIPQGSVFGTAVSYACTTAGGTGGTTSPSSAVIIKAITT